MWVMITSIATAIISAVAAYFAAKAHSVAADIKKNGVTHIVAQVTPSTALAPAAPVAPVKTVIIDGVTYTAKV